MSVKCWCQKALLLLNVLYVHACYLCLFFLIYYPYFDIIIGLRRKPSYLFPHSCHSQHKYCLGCFRCCVLICILIHCIKSLTRGACFSQPSLVWHPFCSVAHRYTKWKLFSKQWALLLFTFFSSLVLQLASFSLPNWKSWMSAVRM